MTPDTWIAKVWIKDAIGRSVQGHPYPCTCCSGCSDATAARYMEHLIENIDRLKANLDSVNGAMANAIRAYRAATKEKSEIS